jgi:hypothetical protein
LQFAKASAATLPQQEKNDTLDVQRERKIYPDSSAQWQVSPRADAPSMSSSRWP